MVLELQQMRSKLIKAKKEAYRLEKAIAKNARAEAQALEERAAPPTPSSETLLGDWVAEERPRLEGGERTWALSRKSSNASSSGSKAESKRSAPSDDRSAPTSFGTDRRRGRLKIVFLRRCVLIETKLKLPGKRAFTYPVGRLCQPVCRVESLHWHAVEKRLLIRMMS